MALHCHLCCRDTAVIANPMFGHACFCRAQRLIDRLPGLLSLRYLLPCMHLHIADSADAVRTEQALSPYGLHNRVIAVLWNVIQKPCFQSRGFLSVNVDSLCTAKLVPEVSKQL